MKSILIVGGQGTLLEELYHKLSREGNHVSVLTNTRSENRLPRMHHYAYDSDSVREVIDSCNPDTVLFLGAYDVGFTWSVRREQSDYKAYISGLSNLLRWSEATGVQRFIYLSSQCVFEGNYTAPVTEQMSTSPRSTKAVAVSLGESIAANYRDHQILDVVIARLDNLYYIPRNARECRDKYSAMCLKAVTRGQVDINAKIVRSALYISDAVQALLQLINATTHEKSLYHITSDERITEDTAAQIIRAASSKQIDIVDQTVGMESCNLLADQYFGREFAFSARNNLSDCLPKLVQQIQSNIGQYVQQSDDDQTGTGRSRLFRLLRRLIPYFESLIVFIIALLAELFLSKNPFFLHVDFFLLYVLLFSLIHGLHLSIFSASLSVAGYFITNLTGSNQLELLMDVGTYIWIAQIFIIGMSVGHLRDRLIQLQSDKDEEIGYLSTRLGDITTINKDNVVIKNYFEQQTINNTESLGYFYDIVAQLDAANENEVMFVAVQLLADVMGTDAAAIYTVSDNGFCRLMASTTQRAYELGKSIRVSDHKAMFDTLSRDYIFVNRNMDEKLPNMASALVNDQGQIEALVFLWDLPYDRMTLHYSNTLRILSLLIRSAIERTTHYLEALTSERYWKNTNILQAGAFRDIYKVYENARQKNLTDYALLRIKGGITGISDISRMNEILRRPLRKTDYIAQMDQHLYRQLRQLDYIGYLEDGSFYILLTNTTQTESRIVIRRLADNGMNAATVTDLP